ncbi:hypothetical protein L6R53_00725 [Myxococcota bacterium]|nr:hypothetical protein [Myxococcota bacterium]
MTLLLWWGLGCGGRIATITIDEKSTTLVEQGTLVEDLLGSFGFQDFAAMDITEHEELANQGVEPGDITEVRMVSFELEAIDPDGADLAFIDELSVSVEAPDLAAREIAWGEDFPDGQGEVALEVSAADLTDYVTSQSMTITTDVSGHRPSQDTTVQARFRLEVGVTARGALRKR